MPHPLVELGGSGDRLALLLPANGFPPETYPPALTPVLARVRVVSLPPRALWEDAGEPPEQPGSWMTLADDLLEGMQRHRLPPVIAIGHSFGGVAALLAAAREPQRFLALALLDPTVFPPDALQEFREQRERGEASSRRIVQQALNRRDRFASQSEAFEYWRSRPLFADWSDDMLLRYTRAMLTPAAGGGLTLRWPRGWEAHYYESLYTETWEQLSRLDPAIPVLVVRGERSDTFLPEAAVRLAAALPSAVQRTLPGQGHLFPQAAPEATGRLLAEWLDGLAAAPGGTPDAPGSVSSRAGA